LDLLTATVIRKRSIVPRYASKCLVCGGCHSKRILLIFLDGDKRRKKSICFSIGSPFEDHYDSKKNRGILYKKKFPNCLRELLEIDIYRDPWHAGKVLRVRDNSLECVRCYNKATGGLWVSTHRFNFMEERKAICVSCLGVR